MMAEKDESEKSSELITEQQRELAQSALNEFNKGNYCTCMQNLNKIDGRSSDFKLAHNKAVVELYKNETKKVETFQKALNNVFTQFQLSLEKLDDVDHCILHYNQAILLYHQQQYTAAIRIMDRVYKFIEPMDEDLGKRVGLLMTELQLCIKQPEKALGLLSYLQNQVLNGNENIKVLKVKGEKEPKEKKIVPLNAANELFLKNLSKYRARCYLMTRTLDLAKKELQTFTDIMTADVLFMKANLEYLQGSYNESIKILTSVPVDSLKYSEWGEDSTVLFYNNIGVVHYAMGKPNLACHYFQSALKEDISRTSKEIDNTDKHLHKLGGSKYHETVFNLGLALLHASKPIQAFECLVIAVRRFHRNSKLWLRLAECCIMAHKQVKSNEIDFDLARKQKEMVVECIGSKEMQKVILTTNMSKDKKYSTESQSYAVPMPTLEFASLCLKNAYLLLPSDAASSPVPLLLIPGVTPPAPPPSPGPAPSNPLSTNEICKLRNAILAASSYVSLCLGDYILALEYAKNLLSQPKLSEGHRLLANLYAAESLVLLDKISDALEYLNPDNVKNISFELPNSESSQEDDSIKTEPPIKWFPTTTSCAIAVMQYNIAVAKTIRGQLDQAGALLSQIWQSRGPECKVPAQILMLVLYIELKLGHADVARSLIKQYSFQQRING